LNDARLAGTERALHDNGLPPFARAPICANRLQSGKDAASTRISAKKILATFFDWSLCGQPKLQFLKRQSKNLTGYRTVGALLFGFSSSAKNESRHCSDRNEAGCGDRRDDKRMLPPAFPQRDAIGRIPKVQKSYKGPKGNWNCDHRWWIAMQQTEVTNARAGLYPSNAKQNGVSAPRQHDAQAR
jgi:hypothetical protein